MELRSKSTKNSKSIKLNDKLRKKKLIHKYIFEKVNTLNKNNYLSNNLKSVQSMRKPKKINTEINWKSLRKDITKKFDFKKKLNYKYNISYNTIPGVKNGDWKENQDRFFVIKNILNNKNNILLGIVDGHGENGALVAEYVKSNFYWILENLLKNNCEKENMVKTLKYTFIELNKFLIKKSKINLLWSGCTLSIVLIFNQIIYCANVGDSEVFMIKEVNDIWKCVDLSKIHSPYNEVEKNRIIEFGGEIRSYYNNFVDKEKNPLRIWFKKENYPGLMMTRCWGDLLGRKIGVIASPYISILNLNQNIKYIVLGSDGLWDNLSRESLLKEIKSSNKKMSLSHKLTKLSKKEWSKNEYYNDDITCITLKIKK